MSFDRLSTLESQPTTSRSTGYSDSPEFAQLTTTLSARLFTLTSNITQLNRQLALVGTRKDSEAVRERVTRLLDSTRTGFREISDGVKRAKSWPDPSPSMRYTQDKLQNQLTSALADFQSAQRLSAEKTRQYVAAAKRAAHLDHNDDRDHGQDGPEVPLVQQQLQQADLADQNEVDFQESLIVQREEEIRAIERGVVEISDIFRDLGSMINDQGAQLDIIGANVDSVAQDHKAADLELRSASRYQKGARNRACCLLLILAVVLTIVLLAVGPPPPPLPVLAMAAETNGCRSFWASLEGHVCVGSPVLLHPMAGGSFYPTSNLTSFFLSFFLFFFFFVCVFYCFGSGPSVFLSSFLGQGHGGVFLLFLFFSH